MQPIHGVQTAQPNLVSSNRFKWLVSTLSFLLAAMFGWGWYAHSASADGLSNSVFQLQTGVHGEIATLKLTGDSFPTEYVMNASNTKNQNTSDHQWVGELMFTYRLDGGAWTKAWTNKSSDGRTVSKSGDTITVTYENASDPEGIRNFKVIEKYALVDDYVKWSIEVVNTGDKTLEIGDLGMPLPFNEYWTGGDEIYETRVVNHSYVGQDGSYMTIGRASGVGPSLLLIPDESTGAGWEYQDRWRKEDHPGSTWSNDESINGGWPEGLNVYYIHSNVIKSTNSGYLPHTSLVLQPGESKAYAFKFFKTADDNDVKDRLYTEGLVDVTVIPGMIFATDMKGKFDLHTVHDIDSVEAQYPDETTLTDLGEVQPDHHQYQLELHHLGQNNLTVHYGNGKKAVLQFYAIEPVADALQRHATFMIRNTQWDDPGTIRDKVFDDWMMQTKSKRGNFGGYWGWGDDWGLTHGQFLAEKNAKSPVAEEIQALDEYLDVAVWTNLMAGHHEDYLVRDFLNTDVLYRGYAYPHIYNTYFSMYKIAKMYPDLIDYKETADTYLMRAYNIFKALYDGPVSYNWSTGLMGESTTPEIIRALQDEGHTAEANDLVKKMATKYDNFKNTKYPYGSEYSYDNTGEEAVYTLAKMNGNVPMMNKINAKTRATRGQMPVWYYYADPVTITGENWWNFQYSVSLVGASMDDWVRHHSAHPEVDQRLSYAAKVANIGAINSGQISSDPANIGASSWTYQAEKGNYGAEGLDGGPLFNGWRGMTGESDLGLFGAIRILSADVSRDPLFGLTGYGAEVAEKGDVYEIIPKDGVFQRLNLITEKLGISLERDQYLSAKVAKSKNYVRMDMKNVTPGVEHSTRIHFRGLKKATYNVLVNGESQGKWNAYTDEAILTIEAGSSETYTVELQEGVADPNQAPTVNAGADFTVTLPDDAVLKGQAKDDDLPQGMMSTTWSLVSGPEGGTANIADPGSLFTSVTLNKAGQYVFKLTATDSELTAEDTVTLTVEPAPPIPEVIVRYHFDETNGTTASDSSGNGKDGELKGGAAWANGRTNHALSLNGVDGYVKMPSALVSRLNEFTISTWVKANALSNYNRIFDFGSGTNAYMFLTPQIGNNMRFVITTGGNSAGAEQMINGPALPVGVWKHVAVTFTGTTGILYVDGVEVGRNTNITLKPSDLGKTFNNYLGKSQYSDPYFNGFIDDFTIYSRALSGSEIASLVAPPVEDIESIQPVQVTTSAGVKPVLPSTVPANLKDGGILEVAVSWEAMDPSSYVEPGTQFSVQGTVVGTDLTVYASVTVTGHVIAPYPELVVRYNLDDGSGNTIADASGNGRNAEIKGSLHWVDAGHKGGALEFSGSGGNYIDLGTSEALQPGSLTLSYWIKRTEPINDAENVLLWFKPDSAYNGNGLFITYNGGVSSYVVVDGFNSFYVAQAPDDFLPLNEWTNIAVTFDSASKVGVIYKNGVAQGMEVEGTPASITPTANTKKIGVSGYGNGAQLHAQLDDFRIYSGAMTAEQILAMYEGKDISKLETVQVTTTAGTPPSLPETVDVTYENGGTGTATVQWEAIQPEKYESAGSFVVTGRVEGTNLAASASVTVTAPRAPELILRYTFDEADGSAVSDASGKGNTGTIVGELERDPTGHQGGSLLFPGTSGNYVDAGTNPELQPSSITVSYWIKRSESMNNEENVLLWFKPENDYANKGFFITYNGTSSIVMVDGTGMFYVNQSPDDFLPLNQWTHIVTTFDSATGHAAIYKDGESVPIEVEGNPTSITATSDAKKIGVSGYGNGAPLHASLDDFRIYNGAMTPQQVHALYGEKKEIHSIKPVQVTTSVGIAPILPGQVTVVYEDQSQGLAGVVWAAMDPASYAEAGQFTVSGAVYGTGIPATAQVTVSASAATIVSLTPALVTTTVGVAPILPSVVQAVYSDLSNVFVPVVWPAIDPASYAVVGQFTVSGSVYGTGLPATAQVTVTAPAATIVSLSAVNVTTTPGVAPVLPSVVKAVYSDGTDAWVPVVWAAVDPGNYAHAGNFTVKGSVEGTSLQPVAHVTVRRVVTNPTTPAAPVTEPRDPSVWTITSSQLGADSKGETKLSLKEEQTVLQLPANAGALLGDRPLIVTKGNVRIEVPSLVLRSLQDQAAGADASNRMVLQIAPVQTDLPTDSTLGVWRSGGERMEFKLALEGKDGTKKELSAFPEPVRIQFDYDPAKVNENTLGIYYWNEKKKAWEYVGGTVDRANHQISGELMHFSKYAVMSLDRAFADLPDSHWAVHAVQALAARGIAEGTDTEHFNPDGSTTRAEFVALLVRAFGLPSADKPLPFVDVPESAWYSSEVSAAYQAGWIQGVTESTFEPNATITREQMAVMVMKAFESVKKATSGGESAVSLTDSNKISAWARDSVMKAWTVGLLQGKGEGIFDPLGLATRAETAEVIYRLLQQVNKI